MITIHKKYLHARVLISTYFTDNVDEVTIIEISPSGKRFKVRYENGTTNWLITEKYKIVEMLEDNTHVDHDLFGNDLGKVMKG